MPRNTCNNKYQATCLINGAAVLLVYFFQCCSAVEVFTPCGENTNPPNISGICIGLNEVELRKCPPLKKLLTERNFAALESTFCTRPTNPNEVPWVQVCCPYKEYQTNPGPDLDDDLTQHKNYKFLQHDSCGQVGISERIIGGTDVTTAELPWMARLAFKSGRDNTDYSCGGTIISSRYILTAAHCFNDKLTELSHVRVAETDEDIDPECIPDGLGEICMEAEDYTPEEVIIHPEYKGTGKPHDIALIRLSTEIGNFSTPFIRPVCLPFDKKIPNIYTTAQKSRFISVAGWGKLKNSDVIGSGILQRLKVEVQDSHQCNNIYRPTNTTISDVQICAGGEKDKGSCVGDSGGPLTINNSDRGFQIGIVSFGQKKCAAESVPVVYTSVYKHLRWILDQIKP